MGWQGIMEKIEGQIQPESVHGTKILGGLSILIIHAVRYAAKSSLNSIIQAGRC